MSISYKKTEATRNFHLSGDMCRIVDDRYHIVIFSSCRFRSYHRLVNRNRLTTVYSNRIGLHSRLGKHPRPLAWRLARLKIPITRRVRALSPTSHHLDASVECESLEKKTKNLYEKRLVYLNKSPSTKWRLTGPQTCRIPNFSLTLLAFLAPQEFCSSKWSLGNSAG